MPDLLYAEYAKHAAGANAGVHAKRRLKLGGPNGGWNAKLAKHAKHAKRSRRNAGNAATKYDKLTEETTNTIKQ